MYTCSSNQQIDKFIEQFTNFVFSINPMKLTIPSSNTYPSSIPTLFHDSLFFHDETLKFHIPILSPNSFHPETRIPTISTNLFPTNLPTTKCLVPNWFARPTSPKTTMRNRFPSGRHASSRSFGFVIQPAEGA